MVILTDIYVPSVNRTYDFRLDENAQIGSVINEISELIEQKEHCFVVGNRDDLILCMKGSRQILPADMTLEECGIRTGSSMILV